MSLLIVYYILNPYVILAIYLIMLLIAWGGIPSTSRVLFMIFELISFSKYYSILFLLVFIRLIKRASAI